MSSLNKNIHTVKCSTKGCDNKAKSRSLCRKHMVQPHMLQTCATEGCNKLVGKRGGKGHCSTHYVTSSMSKSCSVKGCDNNTHRKELCKTHYVPPAGLKICKAEGCGKLVGKKGGKGYCSKHYVAPATSKQCSVENCTRKVSSKGLCKTHYGRMHSKNTFEPPELNQQTTHGYIIHDKTGTPAYVGITCNFEPRMRWHEIHQPWGPYVNIPEQPTVTFENREQASEWEQQTIAKLTQTTPLFNRDFNEHWSLDYEHDLLERTIDIHNQHTMLKSVVESHA